MGPTRQQLDGAPPDERRRPKCDVPRPVNALGPVECVDRHAEPERKEYDLGKQKRGLVPLGRVAKREVGC